MLSGGQRRRRNYAGIVPEHDLIVADEPTGNLDEATSGEITSSYSKKSLMSSKKCIILVTHEQEVAKSLAMSCTN